METYIGQNAIGVAVILVVIFALAAMTDSPELYNPLCLEGGPIVEANLLPPECR
jgi:hypothetical protein